MSAQAVQTDPIGTAIQAKQWLMIEVPRPWRKNPWEKESAELLHLFEQTEKDSKQWNNLRILAVAPDRFYSRKDRRYVISFEQEEGQRGYESKSYWVPINQVSPLVKAILFEHSKLSQFNNFQVAIERHIFVCTHSNYDVACGRFGTPLYKSLQRELQDDSHYRIWQVSHFGGHNFAPTLIDFPSGHFWGNVNDEIAPAILQRSKNFQEFSHCFRGSSSLSLWGQILEREILKIENWQWFNIDQQELILKKDIGNLLQFLLSLLLQYLPSIQAKILLKKLESKKKWAKVEIRYYNPNTSCAGRYRAIVRIMNYKSVQLKSSQREPVTSLRENLDY